MHPPTGKRAVIVGNGSSVDLLPRVFWLDCASDSELILIGTNRALCSAALQGVRFDALVIRDVYRQLWYDTQLGIKYHELWKSYQCWKVGPSHARTTHCSEFVRMEPGWQYELNRDRNRESAVMKNSSVVIMAANMAWHWGARDIAIVGVDYAGSHFEMIPPWANQSPGREGQYDKPVADGVELQFGEMRDAIETCGRIVNLSQGTKLQAVERQDAEIWIRNGH